jgi:hypothetical protein
MKIYLAGPMTGYPDLNRANFEALAMNLRERGHEVLCPIEFPAPKTGRDWEDYMRVAIKNLCECETVATLPEWNLSRGARLEVEIAQQLKIQVRDAHWFMTAPGGRDGGA